VISAHSLTFDTLFGANGETGPSITTEGGRREPQSLRISTLTSFPRAESAGPGPPRGGHWGRPFLRPRAEGTWIRALGPNKGPAPVTPSGARASPFRAGERHQNGSPETSCLTSAPSVPVECIPVCPKESVEGYGVRGDQHFTGMEGRGKRRGGRLGSRGCPSIPDPKQPSRLIEKSGRRVRCGCCRLWSRIVIMGSASYADRLRTGHGCSGTE
jgi:hypothetical protein